MPSTIHPDSGPGQSRTRGKGLQLYREAIQAVSDEAAHADERRTVTRFFLLCMCLRLAGNRQSLMTLFARFQEELAQDPPKPAGDLVLVKGRADRAEDQAREEWHHARTPEARRLLIHRLKGEAAETLEFIRALEAEEVDGQARRA